MRSGMNGRKEILSLNQLVCASVAVEEIFCVTSCLKQKWRKQQLIVLVLKQLHYKIQLIKMNDCFWKNMKK